MILKFRNHQLKALTEFLFSLKLKGKTSRARQKLNDKVSNKLTEFSEDFNSLSEEFEIEEEAMREKIELANEIAVIDVSEYEQILTDLYHDLLDYDHELAEEAAACHGLLLDEMERILEEETQTNIGDEE